MCIYITLRVFCIHCKLLTDDGNEDRFIFEIAGITGSTKRENGFQITSNKKITTLQVKQWEKKKKKTDGNFDNCIFILLGKITYGTNMYTE